MGLMISRRFLVLSLSAAPVVARSACRPRRILFVCPAGTVKSAIAREVLRSRLRRERVAAEVASRGLLPEDHISPALAARLHADGLHPGREAALPLTPDDLTQADIVIAFDGAAEAPALHAARAWRTPSWNSDYDAAKADLARRIDGLVAELQMERCR